MPARVAGAIDGSAGLPAAPAARVLTALASATRVVIALTLALAIPAAATPVRGDLAVPDCVALVHVEANVDVASGGHIALRVGDQAYHYQRAPGERLVLVRTPWTAFVECYAALGNRPLHLATLRLDPWARARVADGFAASWVRQRLDQVGKAQLDDDLAWLAALSDGRPPPPLRGLGLLADAGPPTEHGLLLAGRAAARCGPRALTDRLHALDAKLASLAGDRSPTDARRLRELLQERAALEAWASGRGLVAGALLEPPDLPALSDVEHAALQRFAERLESQLLQLLDSSRPDRGLPLLVLLARSHAVDHCLRTGRLALLDAWPDECPTLAALPVDDAAHGAALEGRALTLLEGLRAAVLGGSPLGEADYNRLEECAGRLTDLRRGRGGSAVRVLEGRLLPSRARTPTRVPTPRREALDGALELARERGAALAASAADRAYDILSSNCVTALLDDLSACFADDEASRTALGGRLDPHDGLLFIPARAFAEALDTLAVSSVTHLPNRRRLELSRLAQHDPAWWLPIRERTTLAATTYTPRAADGAFLFFTDDAPLARPLLGALNLVYGVGASAFGLLTAPFDDGELLTAGLHGAAYSLPELVFGNIRKGSYAHLPIDELSAPPPTIAIGRHTDTP